MLKTKKLLSKNHFASQQNIVSNNSNTYNNYQQALDANAKNIMIKYPNLDMKKIKDLLEQLDNNKQLAIQILQQQISNCNKIIDQKKDQMKVPIKMPIEQQNKLLKQQFLKMYKKLRTMQLKNQQLQKGLEAAKHEIKVLKDMNTLLLQNQYSLQKHLENTPIC